ncbi:MAG: phage portal protein [Ktedonobacterales bacterium]
MTFDFSGASLNDSMRLEQMRSAWDAYRGKFPQPLHNRPRRNNDSVILNRCGPIVDKGVSFLFGKHIGFQVGEDADPRSQAWLDAFWKANRKMAFLHNLGVNGGVTGHVFVKLLEATPYPRLVVLDTTMLSVEHAPDDIENVRAYIISYTGNAEPSSATVTEYRKRIERTGNLDGDEWRIVEQKRVGGVWIDGTVTPWPYPFSPIRQRQNLPAPNQFWGAPDLTPDILQLNRDINFVASNVQRIIKYHAHPKTWVTGLNGNKLSVAPDETIILPEGATMGALEMHSDLASSMAFLKELTTALDVSARIPAITLGDLQDIPRGTISGAAIELLYGVAVEKTETKRSLYGELLEDICRCALAMGGFDPMTDIAIVWPDILPSDKMAAANEAQVYLGLGISKETVFQRLGFEYKDEQTRLVAEARDAAVLAAAKRVPDPDQPLLDSNDAGNSPDQPVQDDSAFEASSMAANG